MRELRGMDVAEDVLSVSARYGERETEEETDREIREIERANAGTRIQNRTQNPIAQTGERRSSVSFLAPKKNIYEERERHSNPPRGPLDATLKIEIERRHRAKDESNDAPRESQQSTIRQTFVLISYSLCVREMLRAFSFVRWDFQLFVFLIRLLLLFFFSTNLETLNTHGGLLTERGRRNHFLVCKGGKTHALSAFDRP